MKDETLLDKIKDMNDWYHRIIKMLKYKDMNDNIGWHIYIWMKDYEDQKETIKDWMIIYWLDTPKTAEYIIKNFKHY